MIVLGIDPGITTGLAILEVEGIKATLIKGWDQKSIDSWKFFHLLGANGYPIRVDHVVIEDFILRKEGAVNEGGKVVRLIGVIEYLCDQAGIPYSLQQPSDKVFVTKRLKEFHYQLKSHWGDAANHAARYAFLKLGARDFSFNTVRFVEREGSYV